MESNLPTAQNPKFRRYYQSLEPLISKQKNRVYTAAIFSFFAISLFGWYAIRPTLNTIIQLRKEIEEKKVVDQKMDDKIASLIEAQTNYQQIEAELAVLDEAIPKNSEVFDVSKQMQNLINNTESTMSSLALTNSIPLVPPTGSPGKKELTADNNEFGFGLNLQGDYPELEKVLSMINTMRRMVNISSFSFTQAQSAGEKSIPESWLNMALQVQTFFKP